MKRDIINAIYTHDEAARIVELLESVLEKNNICVPSPEDDEREEDNMIGLYGSVYSDLVDSVENSICDIISRHENGGEVVFGIFSGTI